MFFQVGGSVFYSDEPSLLADQPGDDVDALDKELDRNKEGALLETKLSSLVWICTISNGTTIATIIDANNPAEILNSFGVSSSHILCIASVPGASPSDYNETVTKVDVCDDNSRESQHAPATDVRNEEDGEKGDGVKIVSKVQQEEMQEALLVIFRRFKYDNFLNRFIL